jgi:hypothetical protein
MHTELWWEKLFECGHLENRKRYALCIIEKWFWAWQLDGTGLGSFPIADFICSIDCSSFATKKLVFDAVASFISFLEGVNITLTHFPSLKGKGVTYKITIQSECVCVSHFQYLKEWIKFHEIRYERCVIGGHFNRIIFNFLQV